MNMDRTEVCARRLGISLWEAAPIANRVIEACEAAVEDAQDAWELGVEQERECCVGTPGESFACTHLRRLWDARSYLELARCKAPAEGAFPCSCNGSGVFYSGGAVVNGVFTGTTGPCFRCQGKGWQTEADRRRNAYYDNHVRRIAI